MGAILGIEKAELSTNFWPISFVFSSKLADALASRAKDLEAEDLPESLASDVCFQEVKFVLDRLLPLCQFLGGWPYLGWMSFP